MGVSGRGSFPDPVKQIVMALLFDRHNRLLVYLRDDKTDIPFPNHWDLFGGHIELGESPEEALVREVREELGLELQSWHFFRTYECLSGDVYPNIKHVYWARIDKQPEELTLYEGQRLISVTSDDRKSLEFANILGQIVEDFVQAGLWPQSPR